MKRRIQPKRIGAEKEEKEGLWFVLSKYNHSCLWSILLIESKHGCLRVLEFKHRQYSYDEVFIRAFKPAVKAYVWLLLTPLEWQLYLGNDIQSRSSRKIAQLYGIGRGQGLAIRLATLVDNKTTHHHHHLIFLQPNKWTTTLFSLLHRLTHTASTAQSHRPLALAWVVHHPKTHPLHARKIITKPRPLAIPYNCDLFRGTLLLRVGSWYTNLPS